MRLHSEEQVCPRRKSLYTADRVLSGGQSERGGHRFWDTEQLERDPTSRGNSCIANEPKRPVEAVMCALRTGQGCRDRICASRDPLLLLDVLCWLLGTSVLKIGYMCQEHRKGQTSTQCPCRRESRAPSSKKTFSSSIHGRKTWQGRAKHALPLILLPYIMSIKLHFHLVYRPFMILAAV
jgi:hypothetical protein